MVKLAIHSIFAVVSLVAPTIAADAQQSTPAGSASDILMRSSDYEELLDEYWPRIRLGDVLAMSVSFNALNNCSHFYDEIRHSTDINDFDERMKGRSEGMIDFGRGIFYKCQGLVERFDDFPGWQQLRVRAALAGDRVERLFMVRNFYRKRYQQGLQRSEISFSPAEYLIAAIEDPAADVFLIIALGEAPYGMRTDRSQVVTAAWMLLACEHSRDCDTSASMRAYCSFLVAECANFGSAFEMIEAEAGGEEPYRLAKDMAKSLQVAIRDRDYEKLGLDLVW